MLLATAIATVRARFRTQASFGDAGDQGLVSSSRAHGNLAEHAPLFVIMIGLLEQANASHWPLTALAVLFLAARAAHIIGLHQPHGPGKPPQLRALGVIGTWIAHAVAIGWTLFLVVTVNG
jgi:uncharacterized membrane protein YecN with MAPEG domain